jgi:hypothetical protein
VLYLENSLASHVFTPARIGVLKLLASQAAISLENAHLYGDLDQAQAYLSEAQKLSQTGSVGWVPSSGELFWSSETYRIFDYDPAIKPTLEMILQRVHPEDRSMVQQLLDRASRTGHEWNLDYRLLPKLTISIRPSTKAVLDTLALMARKHAWRIIDELVWKQIERLPTEDRRALEIVAHRAEASQRT